MNAALPISPLACWLIGVYQRYLSPRKGFRCAYRVRHKRRASCSQFARRAIERLGLLPGVRLLRRRFDKCHHAKQVLDYQTPRREEEKKRPVGGTGSSWSTTDCVSGCDPGVPVDVCDGVTALHTWRVTRRRACPTSPAATSGAATRGAATSRSKGTGTGG